MLFRCVSETPGLCGSGGFTFKNIKMEKIKCKVTNKAFVAGKEYQYGAHRSGIFNMLQVFAGTGDEEDDELFYPDEMEKLFFWEKEKDMPKEAPNSSSKPKEEKIPPKTYTPPITSTIIDPHRKKYNSVLEQIESREEQIKLYPNDPNIESWKIEVEMFKNTAKKIKSKLDA